MENLEKSKKKIVILFMFSLLLLVYAFNYGSQYGKELFKKAEQAVTK
jgi:hypothetical protein